MPPPSPPRATRRMPIPRVCYFVYTAFAEAGLFLLEMHARVHNTYRHMLRIHLFAFRVRLVGIVILCLCVCILRVFVVTSRARNSDTGSNSNDTALAMAPREGDTHARIHEIRFKIHKLYTLCIWAYKRASYFAYGPAAAAAAVELFLSGAVHALCTTQLTHERRNPQTHIRVHNKESSAGARNLRCRRHRHRHHQMRISCGNKPITFCERACVRASSVQAYECLCAKRSRQGGAMGYAAICAAAQETCWVCVCVCLCVRANSIIQHVITSHKMCV